MRSACFGCQIALAVAAAAAAAVLGLELELELAVLALAHIQAQQKETGESACAVGAGWWCFGNPQGTQTSSDHSGDQSQTSSFDLHPAGGGTHQALVAVAVAAAVVAALAVAGVPPTAAAPPHPPPLLPRLPARSLRSLSRHGWSRAHSALS